MNQINKSKVRWLTLLCFCIFYSFTNAQNKDLHSISVGGGFLETSELSMSFTIGEISISTQRNASCISTQGFQQSFPLLTLLPVEVHNFSIQKIEETTELNWQTSSEINNAGVEIQHSVNGMEWKKIGYENSTSLNSYQFLDDQPNRGINYYRLKQFDFDDQFEYSNIIAIEVENRVSNLEVYPNPTAGKLNFKESINGKLTIRNTLGQIVYQNQMETVQQLDLSFLPAGTYLLEYVNQDKVSRKSKFVITKN